ncbi:YajQ family cyclic di-GMP-binding protein [Candidatus Oleimmundimicrobium sp.]|uniref:YajQ family cyclic di-GMP-binding protein n=1 Tax=Candidatus Oleimmundimicrobium sp. TaxID=3060597 RepID=UPI00271980D2|nr:YajQ family cyclic di-GMP-binding protein [Candidatus Oleimmundimicrobium sp.]MDO8885434.1 YajQ family cyclic di-GMP-binding protein [Candidatus Oleimmundimicrobium sp.]
MAKENSFDIVSEIDMQEVDNAINQTIKEIKTRYDLKKSYSEVILNKKESEIVIIAESDFVLKNISDVLKQKFVKRGISLKALSAGKVEPAISGRVRQKFDIVQGISQEIAKKINKFIKEKKIKVKVQIEDNKLRVFGKNKDQLQEAIALVKSSDFSIPLQFQNYR